jgi:hypothetical protein
VVRRFKYLGTVINDVNDEMEEIRARILAANKACSSLQTIFRSKQIHRSNKIRLYRTLIRSAGKPRTRWADVVQRDALQLLGTRGWRRRATNRDEWRRLVRAAKARKGL